ncbi:MAG: hypothetical protein Q8Q23_05685 [bacterium]|nr:hypothetical protein [bacterium]
MKKFFKKYLTGLAICWFFLAGFALAQGTQPSAVLTPPALEVPIPDLSFSGDASLWIAEYVEAIYNYAIGVIGILAAVVMGIGGIVWLTAGGNAAKVSEAKKWIGAALTGLVLALTSYTMLFIINPDLTAFQSLNIDQVKNLPESDPDIPEVPIPPSLAGINKINNPNVSNALNPGITLSPTASLEGVRYTTINGINLLQAGFGKPIVITSGTDGDHSQSALSHAEGYKLDLRTRDNPDLVNYIKQIGSDSGLTQKKYPTYRFDIGDYTYKVLIEPNHLDVRIVTK